MFNLKNSSPLGLYVHVPFCATACEFCAFYQEKPRRGDLERYLVGIEAEMALTPLDRPVDTIFLGGGTPGLLPRGDLERLGQAVLQYIGNKPTEWSVELAPSTVKVDKIEALLELGVTRFSMGVQSFDPRLLDSLGRQHNLNQIHTAYETLRAAGAKNINLDLIFAIPGQSLEDWAADLHAAIALAPEHISTYCLTFEQDTKLYAKLMRGQTHKRSAEDEARFYKDAWGILELGGYQQYEISNFAQPGKACMHNIHTWDMHEWVGIGPSAASQYTGIRYQNPASLDRWLVGVEAKTLVREEQIALTPKLLASDILVFGLRMNAGVNLAKLADRYPCVHQQLASLNPLWQQMQEEGLLVRAGDTIALTLEGRLLADQVGVCILERFG